MKKQFPFAGFWPLLFWALCAPLFAQVNVADSLKARFSPLEPYVHTGFLYDRLFLSDLRDTSYSAHPSKFNGSTSSKLCDYSTYVKLVDDFRESAYDSTLLPSYYQLKDLEHHFHSQLDVPLSVLQLDFQRMDPLAADFGLL